MRVVLRTPLSQWTGYGRDGIGMADALLDRGHDVFLSPTEIDVPLPRTTAGLLTERIPQTADIAIHHLEANKAYLPESASQVSKVSVLWSMWGWPSLPDEPWVETFAENVDRFDYVVAYDPTSAEAFAPYVTEEKLLTVQGGYAAADWAPPEEPIPPHPFTFAMVGKLTVRKGVYDAFQAFCELSEEKGTDFDARLVLISTVPVFPDGVTLPDNVTVVPGRHLPEELKQLYYGMDTLVAPSMAESKHLPPIEALACGVPVILSDIAGHRTWATSDFVSWVPTAEHAVIPGYSGLKCDPEALKQAMWSHYTDPGPQRRRAAVAARTLPAMMDWERCIERLGHRTRTLL